MFEQKQEAPVAEEEREGLVEHKKLRLVYKRAYNLDFLLHSVGIVGNRIV